jgi:hypothetical protein
MDQIHGLNRVLANKVKNFKIHYTVICFYDQFVCNWKENTSMRDLSTTSAAKEDHINIDMKLDEKSHLYNI